VGKHGDLLWIVRSSVLITTQTRMAVSRRQRNPQLCYTGYMPATRDLVRLEACGDPADLIVRFLNTLDVEAGTDAIDTLDGWASWLSAQGLQGCFGPQDASALE